MNESVMHKVSYGAPFPRSHRAGPPGTYPPGTHHHIVHNMTCDSSVFLSPGIMSAPFGEGPGASGVAGNNRRLQQTQAQVDEVVDIMRVNVDKVLERDQKLSELDDRADALQAGASQFETNAAKLKRKFWWKNCKMWAILIAVLIIIIVIIIIWSNT
ncbi:hypothetical protein AMELA_G00006200 [Ameiurus melas]|uniref:V-SNARE coiled-coil homology domain-containing protein n=1 Tax=Ameiurus melas TaxID=219545 RepID=A0A7J6BG15_AMEME|nr:hypothetical protein AMELA_G00006200 [Ameiurus melas]